MYTKITRYPIDEETPLLNDNVFIQDNRQPVSTRPSNESLSTSYSNSSQSRPRPTATPLPWSQLSIMLCVLIAEPMTSQVISPFAPQLIFDVGITHGDDGKIGYYVGLMQSLFFATEALTIMHWARASDKFGRRPILMTGLFGVLLSMILFGLSKTFWQLVVSRSLAGVLNGNVGVAKSVIAEISDSTNLVDAFSYIPMTWAVGLTLGPAIGGYLSNPARRFPESFGRIKFFADFPYFLPCLISALYSGSVCLIVFCFLKETVQRFQPGLPQRKAKSNNSLSTASTCTLEGDEADSQCESALNSASKPKVPSMRRLYTPAVTIAVTNYALVALSSSFYMSFLPVFFAAPIDIGGLGLPPASIGSIMTSFGILNGIIQILMFARLNRWLGSKNLCLLGLLGFFLQFSMFPIANWLARNGIGGVGTDNIFVWCAVALQIIGNVLSDMLFGCILIYVSASSPTRSMLGATNGLAQMATSIMRAIGPALINSLFSLSVEKNILGGKGYIVYIVQLGLLIVIWRTVSMFPSQPWTSDMEDD